MVVEEEEENDEGEEQQQPRTSSRSTSSAARGGVATEAIAAVARAARVGSADLSSCRLSQSTTPCTMARRAFTWLTSMSGAASTAAAAAAAPASTRGAWLFAEVSVLCIKLWLMLPRTWTERHGHHAGTSMSRLNAEVPARRSTRRGSDMWQHARCAAGEHTHAHHTHTTHTNPPPDR